MSGVLVNVLTVIAGTAVGLVFGGLIAERFRAIAFTAIGSATTLIGASMSINGLADMGKAPGALGRYAFLVFVGSLVIGSLTGEAIRIEHWLERFGMWLQEVSYKVRWFSSAPRDKRDEPGEKGHTLVEGFVTASLLFCVGAMTVLGSIQDGLGDHSILYLKSLLDGIAALFLATSLGVGVGLSALPVLVVQGAIALSAHSVQPYLTPGVIACISGVGGALIFAIGLDLLGIKRLPVGNMLPAIILAALAGGILG